MATNHPAVQIGDVERMERELADARQAVAARLRELREASGLSLREVAPRVRLSAAAVNMTERGQTWETETVKRLLLFYEHIGADVALAAHAPAA